MSSSLYKRVVAILKQHGCYFKRQAKGSHEFWHSPISGKSLSVLVTMKSKHTANAVLKQAGIDEKV